MSTISDTPGQGFRLSQLIYDTRYRSLTIQVVAFILLMLMFSALVSNVINNLAARGKDFDFFFLSQPAGYQIAPALIEYDVVRSTHARAALVGIVNTLVVAFLGCIAATIIGVLAGVLRLSKNWVVSKLMTVYVETFRNIPLLLWILLIYAVITEATPAPRAFKGDEPEASMIFGSVAITNRGVYVPGPIWGEGAIFLGIVFVLSIIAAWAYRHYARKQLFDHGRSVPVLWPSVGILLLPILLAFFILGRPVSLSFPELGGFNFRGGINLSNSFIALWLALSLYTGAFIAEIVRGGILAISRGQTEAAYALGIRPGRTMRLVILPQALRVIIPPLISQYLNLTKNSSLALAVGYMDARTTLGGITQSITGKELETMLLLGLFYLSISLLISAGMNLYNSRVKLKER